MASYWWECSNCSTIYDFPTICESLGITHYIWDILLPSGWNQRHLTKKCLKCGRDSLRITYIFPRTDKTHLQVKHLIGLQPLGDYLPMLWETIPNGNITGTWIDFKYVNGRNIWGLNKPAVFTREKIRNLFDLYREITGDSDFP